jgi:hypothetical protein
MRLGQILMELPNTNSVGVPLPPELAMLADAYIDLGFEDWPDQQLRATLEPALGTTGVCVPGTHYLIIGSPRGLVVANSTGNEPVLPANWLRYVAAVPDKPQGGTSPFQWVGKDVSQRRTAGNPLPPRDLGDGWAP